MILCLLVLLLALPVVIVRDAIRRHHEREQAAIYRAYRRRIGHPLDDPPSSG